MSDFNRRKANNCVLKKKDCDVIWRDLCRDTKMGFGNRGNVRWTYGYKYKGVLSISNIVNAGQKN